MKLLNPSLLIFTTVHGDKCREVMKLVHELMTASPLSSMA